MVFVDRHRCMDSNPTLSEFDRGSFEVSLERSSTEKAFARDGSLADEIVRVAFVQVVAITNHGVS